MKEKFIKSTIILIIGGLITKVLGLFIKISMTRIVGLEGLSVYMLILPTFSLAMTITQMSLPIAISKLVSEEKYNNRNLLFSALPISLIINFITILVLLVCARFLAVDLLHDTRCIYPIMAISFTLPFISLSSIIRSYFFGKQRMLPHVISNIIEQLVRMGLILIMVPKLAQNSVVSGVCGIVLVNIISETISFLVLFGFLPNKLSLTKKDVVPNQDNIKRLLDISIPNTSGRIITSIFYFFEPIILTFVLTRVGYSQTYIATEYGIIEGYVLPLIMLPNFFTIAISNSLLPIVSKYYSRNNIEAIKRKFRQAVYISGCIGVSVVVLILLKPAFFLKLLYDTNLGQGYLKILAPVFILYYLQPAFASILQGIDKSKQLVRNELCGIMLKTITIFFFSAFRIGIYGLVIGIMVNITVTTLLDLKEIIKYLYSS